ncbi:hypothetical protein HAP48_0041245 [Bradyrhizobium septentrionale]|uniref:Uncharacterized protein n=1 Tax=Bradyrhizobium septentrionale TaxID=1404411 RepID=A0A973W255_9BRAD|nr:hypothetical protein [Bradyrhizobium septentrionale]UGY14898.1 hypothetical protein HAP48_0041245 [Bradyrhizobium septentrionale]
MSHDEYASTKVSLQDQWEAILKADGEDRARNAESDPYVESGTKFDWFNRAESYDDIDARLDQQAFEINDTRQAANSERKRARELLASGDRAGADYAHAFARELNAQANSNLRRVLRNGRLFSERFARAAEEARWAEVAADLAAAVRSPDADHALKVACTQCLREIAPAFLGDAASEFDSRWLAKRAEIPLRTAQELVSDANRLEGCIAALMIDTEFGSRKALQALADETPLKQREIANSVRAYLPRYLVQHGIVSEKRKRKGSISVAELRALTFIGRNEEAGWTYLTALPSAAERTEWLGRQIEFRERQLEIDQRRSERTNGIIRQIKADQKNKIGSRQRGAKTLAAQEKDAA